MTLIYYYNLWKVDQMKEKIKKEKKDHFAALSKITTMYAQNVELAY